MGPVSGDKVRWSTRLALLPWYPSSGINETVMNRRKRSSLRYYFCLSPYGCSSWIVDGIHGENLLFATIRLQMVASSLIIYFTKHAGSCFHKCNRKEPLTRSIVVWIIQIGFAIQNLPDDATISKSPKTGSSGPETFLQKSQHGNFPP